MVIIWLMMVNNILWLVVEPTPLKHMNVSWGWWHSIPNWMESHKIHVPTPQPVTLSDVSQVWDMILVFPTCFWSDFSRRSYQQTEDTRRFCQDLFAQMWAPSGVSMLEGERDHRKSPCFEANTIWLVVSTPLKNMKVSWDDYSQYMKN